MKFADEDEDDDDDDEADTPLDHLLVPFPALNLSTRAGKVKFADEDEEAGPVHFVTHFTGALNLSTL